MGGKRKATRTITARLDGGWFEVNIEGIGSHRWLLPEQWNRPAIAVMADEAKAWAIDVGDATHGQTNYIQKQLSEARYHVAKPRRHA